MAVELVEVLACNLVVSHDIVLRLILQFTQSNQEQVESIGLLGEKHINVQTFLDASKLLQAHNYARGMRLLKVGEVLVKACVHAEL
jgi:hypothetical protein